MKTTDIDSIELTLNNSQALIQLINANVTYCAWQRGGGKTGGGIGPRIMHLNEVMPGSQIILFSDTYERLIDRIVPNICYFLEAKLGWVEGEDFVKYKKPPDDWEKPIIPLDKFDKVISTNTGIAICLVSLHVEGSANAFNAVAAIGDEIKYCDEEKIDSEVLPALRGLEDLYGQRPEYLSVWMFTDKFGPKVKWFLKKKKLMDVAAVQCVYDLQMEVLRLKEEREKFTSDTTIRQYDNEIALFTEKANRIRKNLVYYSDMKPYENKAVLGDFFFKRARRIAGSQYVYNVAYLNHDPDKIEHSFYPTFTDYNKYTVADNKDCHTEKPLIITMDFNWRFVPIIVAQKGPLPGNKFDSLNIIDFVYALHPLGLDDCLEVFCKRYENHLNRTIYFVYDQTVIGRKPTKKSFKDIVVEKLMQHKFNVVFCYVGKASEHDIRFERTKPWMLNRGEMALMVNKVKAEQLIKSIEGAGAKTSGGITKKDKSTETQPGFPPEDSTHASEAFDMLLWGIYEKKINISDSSSVGQDIVIQ